MMDEVHPLLSGHTSIQTSSASSKPPTILYKRRFYVLILFSLINFNGGFVWNVYGPLEDSLKTLFDWPQWQIDLLPNWGNLIVVTLLPFIGFFYRDVYDLRKLVVAAAFILAIGTGLRCLNFSTTYFTLIANLSSILQGIAAVLTNSLPPVISAVWFSENSRTAATTFSITFNILGSAFSFLAGVFVVPDVEKDSPEYTPQLLFRFQVYMYIQFAFSFILCLMSLIYFPSLPPSVPTMSASVERHSVVTGAKKCLRNFDFWLMIIAFGLSSGCYSGVLCILASVLKPLGVSQIDSGWIGYISTIVFLVGGMMVAGLLDRIKQKIKLFLMIIMFASGLSYGWLLLIAYKVLPDDRVSIYVCNILAAFFINCTNPLFVELSCETCFPVSEFVVNGFLIWTLNLTTGVFLLVAMIPNIGTNWLLISMPVICFLCLPALCIYKERYHRLNVDQSPTVLPIEPPTELDD